MMAVMTTWARLDVGSHQRTRWQRLKAWLFGTPSQVHVTTEIAHGVVAGAVEDNVARRAIPLGRVATR